MRNDMTGEVPIIRFMGTRSFHSAGMLAGMLLGLMAPATVTAAEVFRCVVDGVTKFSDKPCGNGAQKIEVAPPQLMPAGPELDLLDAAKQRSEAQGKRHATDAKAEQDWLEAHEAEKARETRVRAGRIAGEVVEGMTADEVRRMHGDPLTISTASSGARARETWSYVLDDGSRLHVTLMDGVVSSTRVRREKR